MCCYKSRANCNWISLNRISPYIHGYNINAPFHTHDYIQLGWTALHAAVANKHDEIVELLLEAKINPDLPDRVSNLSVPYVI